MVKRNPGALIEDSIRREKLKLFLETRTCGGILLDLGCGPRPYFDLYSPYFDKTIGADLPSTPFPTRNIDIQCEATSVPLPDNHIDVILCTEVLHDIAEPDLFFNEVYRLLKPGGCLFLTSPFVVPIVDGDFDHYRYTKTGLRYRISKSGLLVDEIIPTGDLISSTITLSIKPALRLFNYLAKKCRFPLLRSAWNPLFFLCVILPQLAYLGVRKSPVRYVLRKAEYGATGYVSIARKPS
jgi:SAM-dependent methyltransferase